jgi:hypothetical protein
MSKKPKLSKFRVNYSIMVNGEEFPRERDFHATDNQHARLQLESLIGEVHPPVPFNIHLVTKL